MIELMTQPQLQWIVLLSIVAILIWKFGLLRTLIVFAITAPIGGILGGIISLGGYFILWHVAENLLGNSDGLDIIYYGTGIGGLTLPMILLWIRRKAHSNLVKRQSNLPEEKANQYVFFLALLLAPISAFIVIMSITSLFLSGFRIVPIIVLPFMMAFSPLIYPILIVTLSFVRYPQRHRIIGILSIMLCFGVFVPAPPALIVTIPMAIAGIWGWKTKHAGFDSAILDRFKNNRTPKTKRRHTTNR